MADILAEVDDLMRQDRAEQFWRTHARSIVTTVILIVLTAAALSIYRTWDQGVRERQTQAFLTAAEAENYPDNAEELAQTLRPALRTMLRLGAAGTYAEKGDVAKAADLYGRVGNDQDAPADLRSLGIMMSVRLSGDTHTTEQKLAALDSIIAHTDNPWRAHAMLDKAVILAKESNDPNAALDVLSALENMTSIDPGLKERVHVLKHVYTLDAAATAKP